MQAGAGTFNKECVKEVCVREKAVCDRVFTLCAFVEGSNKKNKIKNKKSEERGSGRGLASEIPALLRRRKPFRAAQLSFMWLWFMSKRPG